MEIKTRCHSCARDWEIEVPDNLDIHDSFLPPPRPVVTLPPGCRAECGHCGAEHREGFEMEIVARR